MTGESLTTTETPSGEEEVEAVENPESLDDSIANAIAELSGETEESTELEGAENEQPAESAVDASEAGRILAKSKQGKKGKVKRRVVEAAELEPTGPEAAPAQAAPKRFDPPQRFPLEKKEWFNRQPAEVQEEVVKGWGELESKTQSLWQDMVRERDKHTDVNRILDHYKPEFHSRGFTETQFIAEMAATWSNLQKDPLGTLDRTLRAVGVTPQQLYDYQQQGGGAQATARTTQQNSGLTKDDLIRILDEREQQRSQSSATEAAAREFYELRQQVGPDGRYAYPEFHNNAAIAGLKPLAASLQTTHPNLGWSEIWKRAVHSYRLLTGTGQQAPGSPLQSSRLSPDPNEIAKVRSASVSVRPRGNGAIPTTTKAKPGESLDESLNKAIAELSQNRTH